MKVLQITDKCNNLSDFYCGMCRYEMLYGMERLSLLFVSAFLVPFLCMASVYVRLLIVTRRQVKQLLIAQRNTRYSFITKGKFISCQTYRQVISHVSYMRKGLERDVTPGLQGCNVILSNNFV